MLFLIAACLFLPRLAETCGPFIPQALFVRPNGPDRPMLSFAKGRLGVVFPGWYRAYLVVAYRYLENKPLSAFEQSSLLEFWDIDHPTAPCDRTEEAVTLWMATRKRYMPNTAEGTIQEYKHELRNYYDVPNCLAPAFLTAKKTLENRARQFGATSKELQEWISGQDAVFSNCARAGRFPSELPATANGLLRADRAYQIAAAEFYDGQFDDAAKRFQAIAHDDSSPWHPLASYLVGRALIRQASLTAEKNQTYNRKVIAQAEAWLKSVLNDPKLRSVHADAAALLGRVHYYLYPDRRQHELGSELARGGTGNRFGQDLRDYTLLLNRFLDVYPDFPGVDAWTPEYTKREQAWEFRHYLELKPQRGDDLSDWVITMQSQAPAAKQHALEKWQSTHSVPWLVAGLDKVNEGEIGQKDLMDAAAGIPADSAAYVTVAYHRARLARATGSYDLARQILKDALALGNKLPPSAAHTLQDEQMMVAARFEDFRYQLWQTPVALDFGDEFPDADQYYCDDSDCRMTFYGSAKPPKNTPLLPQFSPVAAVLLNTQVPLTYFVQVAKSSTLPDNLRRNMAPAAWARAAFLDEFDLAASVADTAITARPELKPFLEAYLQAKTTQERKFAAAFAVLHFPGLRPYVDDSYPRTTPFQKIDDYRDNWWCKNVGESMESNFDKYEGTSWRGNAEENPIVSFPAFLEVGEKDRAAKEWREIRSFGVASRYLPRIVVEWATQHPNDPRVPEALHLAVRATRYGCDEGEPNSLSRQAFTILHKNYSRSEWAKKTPFWF
jgi:hypothetical protein